VKARVLSGNTWSALTAANFVVVPAAGAILVSEINYDPHDRTDAEAAVIPNVNSGDFEFIEVLNKHTTATVNLLDMRFTSGIVFAFPDVSLAPGQRAVIVNDQNAFSVRYGDSANVVGQYTGSLNNQGEILEMRDATDELLSTVHYRNQWYEITDGRGFSLTLQDPYSVDPNALSAKGLWRASAHAGGSPGFDDIGEVPEPGTVVINEVLANPAPDQVDWIELYNATDQALDLGGWFLSDDIDKLAKYEIAPGVSIEPGAYLVFAHDTHFGNSHDPGTHESFALNAGGETIYLHSGQQGTITGYSERARFGASSVGDSHGRHQTNTGAFDFVTLAEPTPGSVNSAPKLGPTSPN
jgi:hypothetical protein